jgi:hypothetical protein
VGGTSGFNSLLTCYAAQCACYVPEAVYFSHFSFLTQGCLKLAALVDTGRQEVHNKFNVLRMGEGFCGYNVIS